MARPSAPVIVAAIATLLLTGACDTASSAPSGLGRELSTTAAPGIDERLRVIATFSILGDLVGSVGGTSIDLAVLAPRGGDGHGSRPSPSDSVALARADLVFENGLGFEAGWLDDLFEASGSTARRVAVSDGLPPLRYAGGTDADGRPADGHGEPDPHMWHDVSLAVRMVERIRDELGVADGRRAAIYRANADAYTAELVDLDGWVRSQIANVPAADRKLVTNHDAFAYLAAAYDLDVVGTILGSATTEAAQPSAGHLADLVETVRAAGVRGVFAERRSSTKVVERVADEAGVQFGVLYVGSLGPIGGDAETYVDLIRTNVRTIVRTLGA